MPEKERLFSWEEACIASKKLALNIRETFNPDAVIGIATGGLFPAKLLKEFLGTRHFGVISATHYDGKKRRSQCVIGNGIIGLDSVDELKNVLLVDDIADSGTTFSNAINVLPTLSGKRDWTVKTAALFKKPESKFSPDYYAFESTDWIVFPWELEKIK